MNLTENFTLEEFTYSRIAVERGIRNIPTEAQINNMRNWAIHIGEPLRLLVEEAVNISSGFRSAILNKCDLIKGSSTSQHLEGKATDIWVKNFTPYQLYVLIKSKLEFDQLIIEKNHKIEWIHVSWNGDKNRNQAFAMNLSNKNMPIIQ